MINKIHPCLSFTTIVPVRKTEEVGKGNTVAAQPQASPIRNPIKKYARVNIILSFITDANGLEGTFWPLKYTF